MKNQGMKFKKDQDGFSYTIIFLAFMPLFLFLILSSTNIKRTQRTSNISLQSALSSAVNSAAHMVDKESQAMGEPRIDYERAFNTFKEILGDNLLLVDFNTPSEHSSIKGDITYWFLVYNGDDIFKGYDDGKLASYAYFTNENGYDDYLIDNNILGFPRELYISHHGFIKDSNNIFTKLNTPSVTAIIKTRVNEINKIRDEDNYVIRWAKAEIIMKE